jgi:hypothetical protein
MRQANNERMVDIMKTIKLQGIHTPQKSNSGGRIKARNDYSLEFWLYRNNKER